MFLCEVWALLCAPIGDAMLLENRLDGTKAAAKSILTLK
jgi:hypothetical protein